MKFAFAGTSGGIQTRSSGNTSIILMDGGTSLLVDVSGSPAGSLAAVGIDPAQLGGVFLTHAHVDHLYALPSLLHNLWLMGRVSPLRIAGNRETLEIAQRLCGLFSLERKPGFFKIEWVKDRPGASLAFGPFAVKSFAARHGLPTLGLVVSAGGRKLVYSADTAPLEQWPQEAAGACVLAHEASGLEDGEASLNASGHSSARQAALAATTIAGMDPDAPPPCLLLCHLPLALHAIEHIRIEAQEFYRGIVRIPETLQLYDTADFISSASRKLKE